MKKLLLIISFVLVGVTFAHANNSNSNEFLSNINAEVQVDGTYVGSATPTKMNGIEVTSGKSYNCTYTIEKGYLSGSFKVGPHFINMSSTQPITGTGFFEVRGEITLLGMKFPFDGNITISVVNGVDLTFTCHAVSQKAGNPVSEFSFTTN